MRTKQSTTNDGTPMHYSVGAIIERDGKYLLLDRVNPPLGFAAPAGHVDEGEIPKKALEREVAEETGLTVDGCELVFEEDQPHNRCVYGIEYHRWYVYRCGAHGKLTPSKQEAKSAGWYTPQEIKMLTLEPIWREWLTRLNIIAS